MSSSASPSSTAWPARSIRFCFSGFVTISSTAAAAPTRRGASWVPPQPGMIPRKTSGKPMWRTERARVRKSQWSAISSPPPSAAPLIAASVGYGRSRIAAKASCPAFAAARASSGVVICGELGQVGADREDERLAGEHEAAPVAVLELRQELGERCERSPAEDVRLLPVLAVVDRDERDRADARLDAAGGRTASGRQPWRVFSHRSAAPMPRPMQSAVKP